MPLGSAIGALIFATPTVMVFESAPAGITTDAPSDVATVPPVGPMLAEAGATLLLAELHAAASANMDSVARRRKRNEAFMSVSPSRYGSDPRGSLETDKPVGCGKARAQSPVTNGVMLPATDAVGVMVAPAMSAVPLDSMRMRPSPPLPP